MEGPYLIDLTRLSSRLGRGALTGIDRVEFAWAEHLLAQPEPLFGLVRLKLSFALLDRNGISHFVDMIRSQGQPEPASLLARCLWRKNPLRARAETFVRRLAVARKLVPFLQSLLSPLPDKTTYLNLGHSNLTARVLSRLHRIGHKVVVLLHDTIPLDHPEYTRKGISQVFRRKLCAVAQHADLVIHTTQTTREKSEHQMRALGRVPFGIVSSLGVTSAPAQQNELPADLDLSKPFVIALGTVEPRKNLSLLCEVWDGATELPRLLVVGHKGWADPQLFDRLSTTNGIEMLGPLSDGAVAALMDRALALVFPSLAEGFGLPPLEAAARGLPILCSDLPVLHEILGDLPVYLKPTDVYGWGKAIHALGKERAEQTYRDCTLARSRIELPTWESHFNTILTASVQESSARTRVGLGTAQ